MTNLPQWRFNFSDKWQEKTLGEVAEIQDGTHGSFKRTSEGHYLLSAKNVIDSRLIISDDESRISDEDYQKIVANGFPVIGDILMSCVGIVGRCCILKEKNLAFQRSVAFIRAKNICTEFLLYSMQSEFVQRQLKLMTTASVQGGIYLNSLRKIKIKMPPLEEQKEIGEYFFQLDKSIIAQEKELESWRLVKKSLLQKIFSRQYKFVDDAGNFYPDWQEKTLGEITDEFKSGKSLTSKDISPQGLYPVYGGNGLRGFTDKFTHEGEYVLIGRVGALCGNIHYIEGKNFVTEHAIAVKANEKNSTKFLKYLLEFMNLGQYQESTAQPVLAAGKLIELKKFFPCLEEQKKIGEYFQSLDNIIESSEKILCGLRLMKRGLLQKLFV